MVVQAVEFSPDGEALATGSWDGTVRIWDPVTGTQRHTFTGHRVAGRGSDLRPEDSTVEATCYTSACHATKNSLTGGHATSGVSHHTGIRREAEPAAPDVIRDERLESRQERGVPGAVQDLEHVDLAGTTGLLETRDEATNLITLIEGFENIF